MSQRHNEISKESIFSSLTCSQIWLNPHVEDHQSTCLTKLTTKPNCKQTPV
jgi:hypothetical protein